jgi:hypothetical protein
MNNKLLDYFKPKSLDLTKENPLGIILAFKKDIAIHPDLFDNLDSYEANKYQKFSILIFYSFITMRVERYLMNHSQLLTDYSNFSKNRHELLNNNLFVFKKHKFYINNSEEHETSPSLLNQQIESFGYLTDGILSTKFYNMFVWELLRDYFVTLFSDEHMKVSYKNPNMDLIRKITHPLRRKILEDPELTFSTGSGDMSHPEKVIINSDIKYKLKDFTPFDVPNFLNVNHDLPFTLYVPRIFKNTYANNKLKESQFLFNINIKTLLKKDYPLCLLDLKSTLNFKNIENIHDVSRRIKNFNHFSLQHLNRINNT